ncbi:ribonuclease H-like domain-containing protein [Tanacetum coccineum]|uniref:Ribonuclease H-like domain-containing protein n=1 Tax=Tanacetum coccineum TaxID=301880 RepID=A0ABQ5B5Y7_9ASTR
MSANDNFSLNDDEELSLHDDASLDGSAPASNKGDAPAKPPQIITTNTLSNIKLPIGTEEARLQRDLGSIKTRFGGNANSKKMQKAVLKQQFEAFTISSWKAGEKGYDSFKNSITVGCLGAGVSDEDANIKVLRSFLQHGTVYSQHENRKNIDTLSIDDLEVIVLIHFQFQVNTNCYPGLADEVIPLFCTNADDVDLIHEDLDQIDDLDLEEMDINWQIAMTAIKIKKFYKKTGRRPRVDGKMHVAFDKRKVECFNCHNTGHFARECKFKGSKEGGRQEAGRGQDFKPVRTEKEALMTIDEGQINWVEQTEDEELNHALMAFTVNNELIDLWAEPPTVKIGLAMGSNQMLEVLRICGEISRGIFAFRETNAGYNDIPLYSRFKQLHVSFKSAASRFNTGKQHVNSGCVHVNAGTQIKSGASSFNTGKQHINSGCVHINTARVNRPVSYKTSLKPSQDHPLKHMEQRKGS